MSTNENRLDTDPDGLPLRPAIGSRVRHKNRPQICSSMGNGEILTVAVADTNLLSTYGGGYILANERGEQFTVPQTRMCEAGFEILPANGDSDKDVAPENDISCKVETDDHSGQLVKQATGNCQLSCRDNLHMMLSA